MDLKRNVDHQSPQLVAVSDVTLGYGSPQITALMQSLSQYYQQPALVIEPYYYERRGTYQSTLGQYTVSLDHHPHTYFGRYQYLFKAAAYLNATRPDIVVIFCTFTLPVLMLLRYKPKKIIYYCIEMITPYGQLDVLLNQQLAKRLDLIIFPEKNRALFALQRCGFAKNRLALIYNASMLRNRPKPPLQADQRIDRSMYAGTLHLVNTCADFFMSPALSAYAIDIFGRLNQLDKNEFIKGISYPGSQTVYRGMVPYRELQEMSRHYAYTLINWNGVNENQFYAAPNKLFDAIANNVPPISSANPQCKEIIERYRCGILWTDWSFDGFLNALSRAKRLYGTTRYAKMVEACEQAFQIELNWDEQFRKLKHWLD